MAGDYNKSRRTLLGASALGFVAAQLGSVTAANAQAGNDNRTSASGTSKVPRVNQDASSASIWMRRIVGAGGGRA
jgi:hypothetical protein